MKADMSQRIVITLPDDVVGSLGEIARARGQTLEEFASESLQKALPAVNVEANGSLTMAEERFIRWIGSVSLGHPTGIDNESIDADLASQYDSTHEGSH
jgi:hypothetical protein